jgi:hypothetical protein
MTPKRCSQCSLAGRGDGKTLIPLPGMLWRCVVCGYYYALSQDRKGVTYVGKTIEAIMRLMHEDHLRKGK